MSKLKTQHLRLAVAFVTVAAVVAQTTACGDDPSSAVDDVNEDASADAEALDTSVGADADTADADSDADASSPDDTVPQQEPPFWQSLTPLTAEVQENAVVGWDSELVIVGGFANGFAILDRVRAYNPSADAWRTLPSLPEQRHHVNAAAVGDHLYVLGGLSGFNFAAEADAWRLARDGTQWESVPSLPAARGSAATVVVDGEIWLLGGLSGGVVADVDVYSPSDRTWRPGPGLPEPRDHLVAAVVDGVIYAIGGRQGAIGSVEATVWRLQPGAEAWEIRTPMPTARGGCMAGVVDGAIIVVGGEGDSDAATGVFDNVELYDPESDSWTILPPMPTPRHGTGAWGFDGSLFVPGGADVEAFGAVTSFERLVLR